MTFASPALSMSPAVENEDLLEPSNPPPGHGWEEWVSTAAVESAAESSFVLVFVCII